MQDFSSQLEDLARRLADAEQYLRIAELRARRPQLETELGRPDLWDDQEAAQAIQREFAAIDDAASNTLRPRSERKMRATSVRDGAAVGFASAGTALSQRNRPPDATGDCFGRATRAFLGRESAAFSPEPRGGYLSALLAVGGT